MVGKHLRFGDDFSIGGIPDLSMADLKDQLKLRDKPTAGSKAKLIERLVEAINDEAKDAVSQSSSGSSSIDSSDESGLARREAKKKIKEMQERAKKNNTFSRRMMAIVYNKVFSNARKREEERLAEEKRLIEKEERMMEDLERVLMELEERRSWLAFEMNIRNFDRMKRLEDMAIVLRSEALLVKKSEDKTLRENGLSYYRGNIISDKRPQNSAAKHFDLRAHTSAVVSCKLSKCLNYVMSCSEDNTARVWLLRTGKCIMVYTGHTKRVNDCDIHPTFGLKVKEACAVTGSGDCTLRLWNGSSDRHVMILQGHIEPIYRVMFSPTGGTIVSCSEDSTVRTWAFPDGFQIYVYRAHAAPVVSVQYSPSGRFIVSGSGYGERNMLLWDGMMPKISQPLPYPHMIFWTPDGRIKKILLRQMEPKREFWLKQDEIGLVDDNAEVEMWPGELAPDEEMPTDSEDEAEEVNAINGKRKKKRKKDAFYKDDVRNKHGLGLLVLTTDDDLDNSEALEYIPGGVLTVSLQAAGTPIVEAYLSVQVKEFQFDMYKPQSGEVIGRFLPDAPLPWEIEKANINPRTKKPYRTIPLGLGKTRDESALIYKAVQLQDKHGEDLPLPGGVSCVWKCPAPDQGAAVVVANIRRKNERKWTRLTWSLRESLVRIFSKENEKEELKQRQKMNKNISKTVQTGIGSDAVAFRTDPASKYASFDQERQHNLFWGYVRDKQFDAAEAFLEAKSVIYYDKQKFRRPFRIMEVLKRCFADTTGAVVTTPFIYKPGVTRSKLIIQTVPAAIYRPVNGDIAYLKRRDSVQALRNRANLQSRMGTASAALVATGVNLDESSSDSDDDEDDDESSSSDEGGNDEMVNAEGADASAAAAANMGAKGTAKEGEGKGGDDSDGSNDGDAAHEGAKNTEGRQPATIAVSFKGITNDNSNNNNNNTKDKKRRKSSFAFGGIPFSGKSKKGSGDTEEKTVFIGIRPRTRPLYLPQLVYTDVVEGPDFQAKVLECATFESDTNEYLRGNRIRESEEIREFLLDPRKPRTLLRLPKYPVWLPNGVLAAEQGIAKEAADVLAEEIAGTGNAARPDAERIYGDVFHRVEHNFIVGDKFGPDVIDFQMPLPLYFPRRAGQQLHAFRLAFADWVVIYRKKRLEEKALSLSLKDIESEDSRLKLEEAMANLKKSQSKLYALQNIFAWRKVVEEKREFDEALLANVSLFLLHQRAYTATRRKTFFTLPGLAPHNPNLFSRYSPCDVAGGVDSFIEEDNDHARYDDLIAPAHDEYHAHKGSALGAIVGAFAADAHGISHEVLFGAKKLKPRVIGMVGRGQNAKRGMIRRVTRELNEAQAKVAKEAREHAPTEENKEAAAKALRPLGKKAAKYAKNYKQLKQRRPSITPSIVSVSSLGQGEATFASSVASMLSHAKKMRKKQKAKKKEKRGSKVSDLGFDLPADTPGFEPLMPTPKVVPRRRDGHIPPHMYTRRREAYPLLPGFEGLEDIATNAGCIVGGPTAASMKAPMELFGDVSPDRMGPHPLVENATVKSSWLSFGGVTGGDNDKDKGDDKEGDKGEEEQLEKEKEKEKRAAALGLRLGSLFRGTRKSSSVEEKKETSSAYLADLVTNDGEINRKPAPVDVNATGGFLLKFNINGLDMVHTGAVNDVYFAPSECRVATAGGDKFIKLWDPRDGSFVKRLEGHHDEVTAVRYTTDELFIISAGADMEILMWDVAAGAVIRRLHGHSDVVSGLAVSGDSSFIVSSSLDFTIKTWFLTPRPPDPPEAPMLVTKNDITVMIKWTPPPAFNLEISAYHLQFRVGLRGKWHPLDKPVTMPPWFRTKLVTGLEPLTQYQFRLMAENEMGKSAWGEPSKIYTTEMGLPTRPERPTACIVTKTSLSFFWFSRNPAFYGGANKQFEVQFKGNSKDYEENPCFDLPYDAVFEEGERILVELTSKLFANRKTAGDVNLERGNEPFVRYRDPPPPPLLGLGFAAKHVKILHARRALVQEQLEEELRLHGSPLSPATKSLPAMMYDDFGVGPGPGEGLPPWPAEGQGQEPELDGSMAGGGPGGGSSPTLVHDAAAAVNDVHGTRTSPTAEGRRTSSAVAGASGDNNNAGSSIRGSLSQAGDVAGGVSPSRSPSRSPSLRPPPLSQPSPSGKSSIPSSPLRGPTAGGAAGGAAGAGAAAGGGGGAGAAGASSPSPSSKGGGGWSPESKSVTIAAAGPSSSKKNSPSKGSVSGGGGSLVLSVAGGGPASVPGSSPLSKGPLSPHGSTILLPINDADNNNNVPPGAAGTVDGGLDAGSSLTTLHEGSSFAAGGAASSSSKGSGKASGKGSRLPPKEVIDEDAEQLFQNFEGCFLHPDAIEQVVAKKAADETCVLLAFTIPSLQMGMNYRVKVRGVNALGSGPWSTNSFAVPTAAGTPAKPIPPKASEQTMSSLTYSWDAPDDNGSAITGYRIKEELYGSETEYDRTISHHHMTNLLPGRPYRVKLQAKNLAGWSRYSDWSNLNESTTAASRPEFPTNLLAVEGSWNSISVEGDVPYHNGSYATAAFVQKRIIDAYSKGAWDVPEIFRIPEDVTIVNECDLEEQARRLQDIALSVRSGTNLDGSYNPFATAREHLKTGRRASADLAMIMANMKSENRVDDKTDKPTGSRILMKFINLLPDTIFEFRVAYRNQRGLSEYSLPSRRAKTNRARLPGKSLLPTVVSYTCDEVVLLLDLPDAGGEPISHFTIESKDTQKGFTREDKYDFKPAKQVNNEGVELGDRAFANAIEKSLTFTVKNLVPQTYYQFRAKAESLCGFGPASDFTEPLKLPAIDVKLQVAEALKKARS